MFNQNYDENPFIVIWEVTKACALKCLHCRADAQYHRDPRELTLDEGKQLIDQIADMGNPLLVFTGGDPLQRPDLFDLAEYAIHKGLQISMTPSATPRVTKEAIERAKQIGFSRWAFSIDGPTAELHDKFRGVPGSFDITMRAINWLHELEIPLQINTTVSRYIADKMDDMAKLIESLGVVLWSVFFLVPTGRGQASDMVSPVEHEKIMHWLYDLSKRVPFDIKTTAAQHYRRVIIQRKMKEQQESGNFDIRFEDTLSQGLSVDGLGRAPKGVNDGNGFVFISHIGEVNPSGFLPINCGNIRETPLKEIYRNNHVFQDLRNPDKYKGKCGVCEFRYVCGGSRARAYAVSGDYMESEQYCTYIPKALR